MSLYHLQKFLFALNREPAMQQEFRTQPTRVLDRFDLTDEERGAIVQGDIGLVYVLGANGQLLMHFAAFLGIAWPDYIRAMREGVQKYGPVRDGIYAMTTSMDEKTAGI
jgi:hypothetical protein